MDGLMGYGLLFLRRDIPYVIWRAGKGARRPRVVTPARFSDIGYDIQNKKARQIDTETHRKPPVYFVSKENLRYCPTVPSSVRPRNPCNL